MDRIDQRLLDRLNLTFVRGSSNETPELVSCSKVGPLKTFRIQRDRDKAMEERLLFMKLPRTVFDREGKRLGNCLIIAGPQQEIGKFAFVDDDNEVITY